MKKMQNRTKKILIIISTLIIMLTLATTNSFADVGSFESYSSSDYGGSSWSSSDWSSSSWDWDDDDYSYSGSSSGSGGGGIIEGGLFALIIFAIIIIAITKGRGGHHPNRTAQNMSYYNRPQQPSTTHGLAEGQVLSRIQAVDPDFNKEEFLTWSKTLFIKLQQAWTARDWEVIRAFETKELFEQHKSQLQGYIDNNTINVMDRICVNYAKLYNFKQEGDKDVLTVELNSSMIDYIMDATTKQVKQGNTTTRLTNTYLLTFVRTKGMTTEKAVGEVDTTNCPNCGAPTKITSSGKCEYCGSVITTDTHDWALSSLQRK